MNKLTKIVVFFSVCLLVTAVLSQEQLQAYSCSEQSVLSVASTDETHKELICDAASRALEFLASYELHAKRGITIDVVEELIDYRGYVAYGSYDSRTDRISLMSLAAIQKSSEEPMMYDEPFDEEHYGGAVAHEVAHAVMWHNTEEKPISPAPQEYLAHSTQLAVLSEERRGRIIERVDIESWLPGDAISDIYMAIEPTRFAVKSYLHLTSMNNPSGFVTILLNAKWFYVYVPD